MSLAGNKIIGGCPKNGREKDDFYATPPDAVRKLLGQHHFRGGYYLEPCVGNGNIAKVLQEKGYSVDCLDIVDRGYPETIVGDFLTYKTDKRYDGIITNPPFMYAQEFIEKSLTLLKPGGQLAMFLKIQFLEGEKRKQLYDRNAPDYVYVFRKRISAWNNGIEYNPDTGKRWQSVMCMAWYVWDGTKHEPVIRWID